MQVKQAFRRPAADIIVIEAPVTTPVKVEEGSGGGKRKRGSIGAPGLGEQPSDGGGARGGRGRSASAAAEQSRALQSLQRTASRLHIPLVDRLWIVKAIIDGKLPPAALSRPTTMPSPALGPRQRCRSPLGAEGSGLAPQQGSDRPGGPEGGDLRQRARQRHESPAVEFSFADMDRGGDVAEAPAAGLCSGQPSRGARLSGAAAAPSPRMPQDPSPSPLPSPRPSTRASGAPTEGGRDQPQLLAQVEWLEVPPSAASSAAVGLAAACGPSGSAVAMHRRHYTGFTLGGGPTAPKGVTVSLRDCVELVGGRPCMRIRSALAQPLLLYSFVSNTLRHKLTDAVPFPLLPPLPDAPARRAVPARGAAGGPVVRAAQ